MDTDKDFETVQNYLYHLRNQQPKYASGATYNLQSIQKWLEYQGLIPTPFHCIHVAGTNGKGSVCAMLESIYRHNGYKTGLYTSPHLLYVGERIQVNRMLISQEHICEYVSYARTQLEKLNIHLSFFEFMTSMALWWFAYQRVDIALIETGLGGRLDATNVLLPVASVITSISKDHTHVLGTTLEAITREKAGIIKAHRPVIIGLLPIESKQVIKEVASLMKAPLYEVSTVYDQVQKAYPKTALSGSVQESNAATASLTCSVLQALIPVTEFSIEEGLRKVSWDGRWQRLSLADDKTLILDATHNEGSIPLLREHLQQLYLQTQAKPIIIMGSLGLDRATAIIQCLTDWAQTLVFVKINQSRSIEPTLLQGLVPPSFKGSCKLGVLEDLLSAPSKTSLGNPGDTIVVTGSIYLLGEVLSILKPTSQHQAFLQDTP